MNRQSLTLYDSLTTMGLVMRFLAISLGLLSSLACAHANELEASVLPGKADTIPLEPAGVVQPPTLETVDQALARGRDFLLTHQNKNGSWGSFTGGNHWSVYCPPPSGPRAFESATTGLCIIGLEASPFREEPAVREAIDRAVDRLLELLPLLKRGDTLAFYDVWGHAYSLEAICKVARRLDPNSPRFLKLKQFAVDRIKRLDELTDVKGGWGYITFDGISQRPMSEPTSFLTATALIAYHDAHEVFGLTPPEKYFNRSFEFLKSQRTPAGTYVYSIMHASRPGLAINRHTGSLSRSPAGDLCLMQQDPQLISLRQLNDDLERLWSRSGWLSMALKKPIPHESFAQNSGYFFFYGYYYAARAIFQLPESTWLRHASQLADDLLPLQEKDGSWWDFPLYNYHKYYGTGYAMYSLSCVHDILSTRTNK